MEGKDGRRETEIGRLSSVSEVALARPPVAEATLARRADEGEFGELIFSSFSRVVTWIRS